MPTPVILSRTEQVGQDSSPDEQRGRETPDATLVLGDRLGTQGESDVFYAQIGSLRVVVKILDLALFPTRGWNGSPQHRAAKTYYDEYQAFHKFLPALQGVCVPRLGGMFVSGTVYCTVYDDGGCRLPFDERANEDTG